MRAAVVGGSLGGLTAALLLHDLGIEVDVYERSPAELVQRGAGIGFLPESARYLVERAGVALDRISVATSHIRYLDRRGEVVYDGRHPYRFSSWNTVYRELLARMPPSRYHLGHEMTGWVDDGDVVEVHLAGRPHAGSTSWCAPTGSARRRGRVCCRRCGPRTRDTWRGGAWWPRPASTRRRRAVLDDAITYYVYANSHILVYPIPGPDGSVAPGERLMNFVWYRNYLEGSDLDDVLTDDSGQRRDISVPPGVGQRAARRRDAGRRHARGFPRRSRGSSCSTVQPFLQVVYDIEVPRMAFGRVCLIGDAAFVVRPHAAAGTAKAAADAWALADGDRA